jgi:hypothetical protein
MQSEEFDSKTRDAAEHHHPAYDEKAWEKMEKLLNKHLPQKKDGRRRIAFILLFLLLLGGAGFLLITRPWQTRPITISGNKDQPVRPVTPVIVNDKDISEKPIPKEVGENDPASVENSVLLAKEKKETAISGHNDPLNKVSSARTSAITRRRDKHDLISVQKDVLGETKNKDLAVTKDPVAKAANTGLTKPVKDMETVLKGDNVENKIGLLPQKKDDKKDRIEPIKAGVENPSVQKVPDPVLTVTRKTKDSKKKSNPFFLTFSVGPDVSAIGTETLGRMKLIVGGGVGYTFHNRFTIRTGLYSSRKIYTAAPYEYDPPAYFWQIYPDLKQIDADCKVLEIPLSLSYNFSSSARRSWFGAIGLSSYLMKRETYDYLYKDSWGQLQNKQATIYNVNKHYFSVLTLSGGYQRNINNTFSIMAEPYLKIPITGVGYGKVKLAGAGVLFTLGIHPFHTAKVK